MKRYAQLLLLCVILIGCASPAGVPPTSTPESPKRIQMTLEIAPTSTATDEPTFTPIPPTFTLTMTPTSTSTVTATATQIKAVIVATATRLKATATRLATKVPTLRPTSIPTIFLPPTPTNAPPRACCKICSKGKACGDSCISKDKNCNVGPGCACNG